MIKSKQERVFIREGFELVFVAMPQFGHELKSFIQGRIWVGPFIQSLSQFFYPFLMTRFST